jgi:hypothetical protein
MNKVALGIRNTVAALMLLLSMSIFTFQVFVFTLPGEQLVCTALGLSVYSLAIARKVYGLGPKSFTLTVSWAPISGIILGILPPRLRLVNADIFVLFYPLVHALLLEIFLHFASSERSSPERPEKTAS